jgi:glycosyltransferase involved in cell wall biosynthesis
MSGRRKLLFYTHGLTSGGAERVVARLATGFAARGDDVVLAVDFEAEGNLGLLSRNVDLRVLPRGHARATLALSSILRREKPVASLSAISVSNIKHAAAAALAGRSRRAILTYHGFYESEFQRLSNLGYRLTPILARTTGAIVAVSDSLRDDLIARFSVARDRLQRIHNPAGPEPFPAELSREDLARRAPIVLAMGRLAPDKDFITLLRAVALLSRSDAHLVILGEGPERERLQAAARRLGIETRVAMPGHVKDTSVEILRARCFALSSRRETFSLACVEAMAHGLPVVATDCGGPAEIITDAAIGDLVPVGDAAALAKAIETRLATPGDPESRQRRAGAFSLETALDAYDALIRAVDRRALKSVSN